MAETFPSLAVLGVDDTGTSQAGEGWTWDTG